MKTYQDLIAIGEDETKRKDFVMAVIRAHQDTGLYKTAVDAQEYYCHHNPTIMRYQKMIHNLAGQAIPDILASNSKIASNFFHFAVSQENQYLLGNGATFQNPDTKNKLDPDFDYKLQKAGKEALIGGVAFGFFNLDKIDVFSIREFAPLYDEENGSLRAGVRFWQVSTDRPLRATLYEEDGYTEYITHTDRHQNKTMDILHPKRPYKLVVRSTVIDGDQIVDGLNYNGFPIVPLYGNEARQSELVGNRGTIDAFDLLNSNLVNGATDGNIIYWILENADGMNDEDDAKFLYKLRMQGVAHAEGDGVNGGAKATPHTVEAPYQGTVATIEKLEERLYQDFMAFNVKDLTGGQKTATEIKAAYQLLDSKVDAYEYEVIRFVRGILSLAGIDDSVSFTRSKIINNTEEIQAVLQAANYLDEETVTRKVLEVMGMSDSAEDVLRRMTESEASRYNYDDSDNGNIDQNNNLLPKTREE